MTLTPPRARPAIRPDDKSPLLPDVGVIALVPDVWESPWQPRHYVLSRLARYFHVVWCDRPYPLREVLAGDRRGQRSSLTPPPGFAIRRPERWLPMVGRVRRVGDWTERMRTRRAEAVLRARGCRTIIVYVWRPEFADALDAVPHDLACYHVDDEYTFSPIEQPITEGERRLIARADRVFIHSPGLMLKKGRINRHTTYVPNGVDFAAYAQPQPEPEDMRAIPHPRIGYVGRIKDQLDLKLLSRLVARHGRWSFVFVGPHANHRATREWAEGLARRPNVFFLGEKPVEQLPAYTQHLDVGTMCYVLNDYTKFIYPLKLHEYLAAGRPVVATPIRSLLDFEHVIDLAVTEEHWSQRLAYSVSRAAKAPDLIAARQQVARDYDWNRLVATIASTMCKGLGAGYGERLAAALRQRPLP